LRYRDARGRWQRNSARGQMQEFAAGKFHVALPDHVQDERTAVLIAPHASKSDYFLNARPPTAQTLHQKMGLRHAPVGSSVVRLSQVRSRAKGGKVAEAKLQVDQIAHDTALL
jgi:hypothetical protein